MSPANSVDINATVNVTVRRFHERVLDAAEHIIANAADKDDHGSWAAAIALCGTACEVVSAYALDSLITAYGPSAPSPRYKAALVSDVRKLLRSRETVNLSPQTQRKLWRALTKDDIVTAWGDWPDYRGFVRRRNSVVHTARTDKSGALPSKADAKDAVRLARSFNSYLKSVLTREGLASLA